jgi:hypothetical protein
MPSWSLLNLTVIIMTPQYKSHVLGDDGFTVNIETSKSRFGRQRSRWSFLDLQLERLFLS